MGRYCEPTSTNRPGAVTSSHTPDATVTETIFQTSRIVTKSVVTSKVS